LNIYFVIFFILNTSTLFKKNKEIYIFIIILFKNLYLPLG